MTGTFTYEEIEKLLAYGADTSEPDIVELKQRLFEKFVNKALWQMRRDNAMVAENITFQMDLRIEGTEKEAASEEGGGNTTISIQAGCCSIDGCGACDPFNVIIP